METLSNYCLKLVIIGTLLYLNCANSTNDFYKKTFTTEEKHQLAEQFMNGMGNAYYYQGTVGERCLIREAEQMNPENAMVWREYGVPYLKRGFAVEYEEYYKKAVQYDPVEWHGWRGYLYLYFYRDYENAIADFNATDTLTPNFVDYPQSTSVDYMRAICYLQLENYDQALAFLDKHIKKELEAVEETYIDTKTFIFKGIAYHKKGLYDEAEATFKRALSFNPEFADLWFYLAETLVAKKQYKEALDALDKADRQYKEGYYNERSYVEEFYEIYHVDIAELRAAVKTYKD